LGDLAIYAQEGWALDQSDVSLDNLGVDGEAVDCVAELWWKFEEATGAGGAKIGGFVYHLRQFSSDENIKCCFHLINL
jgi:hypothetical protein